MSTVAEVDDLACLLAFASFITMSWHFGLNLEYRFEVAVITIVWTALVILGILLSIFFKRLGRAPSVDLMNVDQHPSGKVYPFQK